MMRSGLPFIMTWFSCSSARVAAWQGAHNWAAASCYLGPAAWQCPNPKAQCMSCRTCHKLRGARACNRCAAQPAQVRATARHAWHVRTRARVHCRVVVDISIAQRAASHRIAAHADGGDRAHLRAAAQAPHTRTVTPYTPACCVSNVACAVMLVGLEQRLRLLRHGRRAPWRRARTAARPRHRDPGRPRTARSWVGWW